MLNSSRPGFLLLEDGTLFRGRLTHDTEPVVAEVVFTTNMTGYQEVFTDPSYRGQIVVMTSPMVGNYGINDQDPESGQPQIAGVVMRELSAQFSNWRATGDLASWLLKEKVPVLDGVDTRRLTRHLRSAGAMRGAIAAGQHPSADVMNVLAACPSMEGLDLASRVTVRNQYQWGDPAAPHHIVAYDYGIKRNILRLFAEEDCRITVVPAQMPAEAVLDLRPDGIFLSNGPGDPAAVAYAPDIIRALSRHDIPMLGICLGHQLIGLTFGASTEKMSYGHRGGNHPVRELETGRVLITSQNHGFTVRGDEGSISGAPAMEVTHTNLNDGTIEGMRHRELPIFAVQYHPEAAPGPHDARPLFHQFMQAVTGDGALMSQTLDTQ
ncbi:MAG: glutamine-hydrolyzing carbamoyl-phosphate synthase small subunit [Gemmatimonadaceae bacterium]|nr:glutamine-hydrolyzing carbamoyl-phosphate synthase small subunit [Gemmatimonadaceae bacterium]MDQ3519831.1 glutamine-hydrolyzing carbamoyl-phosphate synthase small subunit [Gemmatimonadota bacterium]